MAATMAAAIKPARIAEVAFSVFRTGTCKMPNNHQHSFLSPLPTAVVTCTAHRHRRWGASSETRATDLQHASLLQGHTSHLVLRTRRSSIAGAAVCHRHHELEVIVPKSHLLV